MKRINNVVKYGICILLASIFISCANFSTYTSYIVTNIDLWESDSNSDVMCRYEIKTYSNYYLYYENIIYVVDSIGKHKIGDTVKLQINTR